jgi:hypothetical protein
MLVVRMKNICHKKTMTIVLVPKVTTMFKKRTSENKSDGTFDNTENCGLNCEIDKEKNSDINVEYVSRVNQNSSNNMHVEENDAMLDTFKSDIFLKSVPQNLKENTKKSGIIDIYVSGLFRNQKTGLMHWSVIYGSLGAAWMIKSSFMGGYVRSVLTSLNFRNDDLLHTGSYCNINI